MNKLNRNRGRRGFSLVELAIVLGVASILFAGLWRLMSAGSSQMRDQTAAELHSQIIGSVGDYLVSDGGQTWLTGLGSAGTTTTHTLTIPASSTCSSGNLACFLPPGFNSSSTNSYNQTFAVQVRLTKTASDGIDTYAYMVYTSGGDTIADTSGGRISSMIGGDGGFRYTADVCGSSNVCGAYGSWSLDASATYGATVSAGHIASNTYVSGTSSSSSWLARVAMAGNDIDGTPDFNTIQTDISLGGNILYGNGATGSAGGRIENLEYLNIDSTALGTSIAALDLEGVDEVLHVEGNNDMGGNPPATFSRGSCGSSSVYEGDTGTKTCDWTVQVNGGQTVTGLLAANRLYASQFLYNTTSDRRLKHEIKEIDNALEKVASLRGYSFFVSKEKKRKYGVIAQDVRKYFPEIVTPIGKSEYIGLDYMGLIGPIIGAIHELKEKNDALEAELKALKASAKEESEKADKQIE